MKKTKIDHYTDKEALDFHSYKKPGKIEISSSKNITTKRDLALAYSPGVAAPVRAISNNPETVFDYTSKGNLVAVISNGTAILGLGSLGALASKPVMEGKAALLKKFAGIDVFDIEVNTKDNNEFINTVTNISPTFGAINLEDIKAPDCFIIEKELQKRLNIPVFHDDQHGTAISIAAGIINATKIQKKDIASCKIVCLGAGASAIASMKFLEKIGAKRSNMYMLDSKGLIITSRDNVNKFKQYFAQNTDITTKSDVISNCDILIGLAGPDIVTVEEIKSMNENPIIFTLSNPNPEISYEILKKTRKDAIIATGRSDYPNQINNVLCFPYIFRGALNVRATSINEYMMIAAAKEIAAIAEEEVPDYIKAIYPKEQNISFGMDYIIPKPMDKRLRTRVSTAVENAYKDTVIKQCI